MYIMYTCIYNVYLDMSHIIYIYIYIIYIYLYIYNMASFTKAET